MPTTYLVLENEDLRCKRCGYTWTPRVASPASCPYCKRRFERKEQEVKLIELRKIENPEAILHCDLCGEEFREYFDLDGKRVCKDCLVRLVLKEVRP